MHELNIIQIMSVIFSSFCVSNVCIVKTKKNNNYVEYVWRTNFIVVLRESLLTQRLQLFYAAEN